MTVSRQAMSTLIAGLLLAIVFAACGHEGSTEPDATAAPQNPALPGLERVKSGELEAILSINGLGKDLFMRILGPFTGAGAGTLPQVDLWLESDGEMGSRPMTFSSALISTHGRAALTFDEQAYEVDRPSFDLLQASFQRALGDGSPADPAACLEAAERLLPPRLWDEGSKPVAGTAVDGTAVKTTTVRLETRDLVERLGGLERDPGCGAQLRSAGTPAALLAEVEKTLQEGSKTAEAELAVGKDGILREVSVQVALGSGQNVGKAEIRIRLGHVNEVAEMPQCHGEKAIAVLWKKLGFDPLKPLENGEGNGLIGLLDGILSRSPQADRA